MLTEREKKILDYGIGLGLASGIEASYKSRLFVDASEDARNEIIRVMRMAVGEIVTDDLLADLMAYKLDGFDEVGLKKKLFYGAVKVLMEEENAD